MDGEKKKVELMIVCDDKQMVYANYLVALVGEKDDTEDEIIGPPDGMVTAAIYPPKVYKDTIPKITSNTHILFIGKFKEAKEQAANIDFKFNKFGMHYGWLGNRAVMYVDGKMLDDKEYDEFIEFSQNYQQKFEEKQKASKNSMAHQLLDLIAPIIYPVTIPAQAVSMSRKRKKMIEQRYRCLTMAFYLDGLAQFLGEK